jgi:hypothetical protein
MIKFSKLKQSIESFFYYRIKTQLRSVINAITWLVASRSSRLADRESIILSKRNANLEYFYMLLRKD